MEASTRYRNAAAALEDDAEVGKYVLPNGLAELLTRAAIREAGRPKPRGIECFFEPTEPLR